MIREYWVIFTDSYHPTIHRHLRPGFQHVRLLTRDEFNWILIDPGFCGISWQILPYPPQVDVYKKLGSHVKVVGAVAGSPVKYRLQFNFCLLTCVSVVKYFLGIRNILIQTPWQLYRYLEKHKQED